MSQDRYRNRGLADMVQPQLHLFGRRQRIVAAIRNRWKIRALSARFGAMLSDVAKWFRRWCELGTAGLRQISDRCLRVFNPRHGFVAEQAERSEPSTDDLAKSLIEMAVESWRVIRLFDRLLTRLDDQDQSRYRSRFRWFQIKIEESLNNSGMRIVNMEGHPFDPGMAATPLNIEDFNPEDALVVDQMLEPIIMGSDGIMRTGTVTLRKAQT